MRTKDVQKLIVAARWTLVRDVEGRPKSILGISTDVTKRKTLEAQNLRSQRMESLGTLAGGIAHDLNNVLIPLLASVELLKCNASHPEDPVAMLRADLENERTTVGRYRERISQAEAMGEFALSETLRAIIVQEQEHEIDLSAALDISVPLPIKPEDSKTGHNRPKGNRASRR